MTRVLDLSGITMRFGPLVANDDVTVTLDKGEILALLGENGAGKTTLMNILFGHYTADEGTVSIFGKQLPPGKPRAAIEAGVGMVHQHFTLAANLNVLDNIMLGSEALTKLASSGAQGRAKLLALSEKFGLPVDPSARVADLSVGERQRVEILKALYRDAKILILDEPTAVLARPEAERLFKTLREMAVGGLSIIFISHKLHEVMAGSDRVTVLRGGKVVAQRETKNTNPGELAELMVGRQVARPKRDEQTIGAPVVRGRNINVGPPEARALDDISFQVCAGEVLGIVGVSGNGQSALGALLSGLIRPRDGTLTLEASNKTLDFATLDPRGLVEAGVGRIPEDRHAEGAVGEFAVWENAMLEQIKAPAFSSTGFVKRSASQTHAQSLIDQFDIRGADPQTRTRLLSGGNMQKLILARVLAAKPKFILANQPTRGLDEGAIAAVHEHLLEARRQGTAILLISEELEEATALSDRIQAIVKGRLSQPLAAEQADAQTLGLMMAGMWSETSPAKGDAPHAA